MRGSLSGFPGRSSKMPKDQASRKPRSMCLGRRRNSKKSAFMDSGEAPKKGVKNPLDRGRSFFA